MRKILSQQFAVDFPDPLAPKTVVIVPSLTLDPEILSKLSGLIHYEERLLCLLLLLRMPRTRIVYLSSMPLDETIIDYYLHLLPGVTNQHARKRLKVISCHDSSNRPLTQKILERPRLVEQIRTAIPDGHAAHFVGFNITPLEEQLASRLGLPIFGCPSELEYWGTKSGSRKLFKKAGLPLPPGYEDLRDIREAAAALRDLKKANPEIKKAVVKLNDGFSGDGNAIFRFTGPDDPASPDALRRRLKLVAQGLSFEKFAGKFEEMGGIVEAFIEGDEKRSPSCQARITPLGEVEVLSTHDQLLGGESGQIYQGAIFPADADYAADIGEMTQEIGNLMLPMGVLGRFGIDFISVREKGGTWRHYAIEINLRKGGTTHPFLMLQFLTGGHYNAKEGTFLTPAGLSRSYVTTDGLQRDSYRTLCPESLIDIAICNGLHYDVTAHEGVTFHMLGALPEFGKLGIVCVGRDIEHAKNLYQKTVAILERESSRY